MRVTPPRLMCVEWMMSCVLTFELVMFNVVDVVSKALQLTRTVGCHLHRDEFYIWSNVPKRKYVCMLMTLKDLKLSFVMENVNVTVDTRLLCSYYGFSFRRDVRHPSAIILVYMLIILVTVSSIYETGSHPDSRPCCR